MFRGHRIELNSKLVVLSALAAVLLSGCGATMKPRDGATGNTVNTSSAYGASCNQFSAPTSTLGGKVTTYLANGILQEDRVRLRITSIAQDFSQSSNAKIQFFRWTADASGNTKIDQQALSFTLEKSSAMGGTQVFTPALTSLSLADANNYAYSGGISAANVQDFFSQVTFVIQGTDYNWTAMKAVLFKDNAVVTQADMLLPVFSANPNTYAATHALALYQIHPFWNQRTLPGISDADWVARSMSYCF